MSIRGTERGSALVSSLIFGVVLFGMVYATTLLSVAEVKSSRQGLDEVRARALAESGVEHAIWLLDSAAQLNPFSPIDGVTNFFGGETTITPILGEEMLSGNAQVGAYSVRMTLGAVTASSALVTLEATGYLPDAPGSLGPGESLEQWHALSATVLFSTAPSEVFNYAYFVNNWGWLYGSTIFCYGNAGGNGQFDAGGYAPTVSGQPIFDGMVWDGKNVTLDGYHDDNGDGLLDGNDGGIFAGWDVVNSKNVKGNGGKASNQHDFQEPIEMPNLSDLTQYETLAKSAGGTIKVNGVTMASAVYGDDVTELDNLYLVGTLAKPIVLDGPIVVKGDVMIHGYVTGQGVIYAGGNVYVPNSITYVDGPATKKPAGTTAAQTEAWLSANWEKDFLGLFTAENIVVGDCTDKTWQSSIDGWMKSPMNKSEEDAGEDGIPNTKNGKDGKKGTADDDVLEDDGVFTVDYYSEADAKLGLIPPGKVVGDVVPGSGEDIDGDGKYDDTSTIKGDIAIQSPLNKFNWGGNMPLLGIAKYSDIASLKATNLDATFYTNHSFCYYVTGGTDARINGSIVSRNENIVYGTPKVEMNYDCRLLGGASGMAGGMLPQTLQPPMIVRWDELSADPNRYTAP